jgi:chemotaxis protein methyltransferase CheR
MSTATLNAISSDSLTFICNVVRDKSAIELDVKKTYLIEARLAPLAKQNGFNSIDEMVNNIRSKRRPEMESRLVEAMTTNETSFFRDMHPFEALKSAILPEIRTKSATKKTLNIWSAACSSGQEIYSIGMIIREHFPEFGNWKVRLVGTDLSDDILAKAKSAQYSQVEVNRGLSAAMLVKYFERDGMNWKLRPEVRGMAEFTKLNLIEKWPLIPTMDVVFLRNVLIYFCPETKKAILEKIRKVMAPRGFLFLGAAETTMGLDNSFERVQVGNSVFYRLK